MIEYVFLLGKQLIWSFFLAYGSTFVSTATIRKKGDWSSLHIERQAAKLLEYEQHWGDCVSCAVGLQHAKKLASCSFDLPYEENSELFLVSSACT